jgi:hypothetical protein
MVGFDFIFVIVQGVIGKFRDWFCNSLGVGVGTRLFVGMWPWLSSLHGTKDSPKLLGSASPAVVERARVPVPRRILRVGREGTACVHQVLR